MAFLDKDRWRVKVWVLGRRVDKCFPIGTPKRVAEEYERKIKIGQLDPDYADKRREEPKFSDFSELWLSEYCSIEHSYAYTKKCRQIINQHLVPCFGKFRLGEISSQDIQRIQREFKEKGYAVQTINNILATLSSIFKRAIETGAIDRNPCGGMRRLKREQKPELQVWTLEERDRYLAVLHNENFHYFQVCALALFSGLRPSELRGLLRDSIDFERSQIRVHRQWCTKQNKLVEYTKTRTARTVPVPRVILDCLSDKKNLSGDSLLFPFLTNSFGHRSLKPFMVKANVQVIRMHDFRHTFASQLLHGGAPLAEVKELLGHRKLESTMIYLHYLPDRNHGATDRLLGKMGWMKNEENVIPISR